MRLNISDCKLLARYQETQVWNRAPEEDQDAIRELWGRLKELAAEAAVQYPGSTEVKAFTSHLNPSGRTPKELWCCIFPASVPNKSFALQTAIIVSGRGVEICFCLGAGTAGINKLETRHRCDVAFAAMRAGLQRLTMEDRARFATKIGEGWSLNEKWRMWDEPSSFQSLNDWLDHASHSDGDGASISKFYAVDELASIDVADEFLKTCTLFQPLLDAAYQEVAPEPEEASIPAFVKLMRELSDEGVILFSPKQGSRYCISDVDAGGCMVQRLDSESPARVTASAFEARLAWLKQQGGEAPRKDIDNTVAVQICYLQMPEIGLKADRQTAVAFENNDQRANNLILLILSIQAITLYKPVILALVIEAIRDEELVDNNIQFDWLLPRFISRLREHGKQVGEQQLAEGFGRLANDLFWLLAHRDPTSLLDVTSPTPAKIRERVSHARLQEAYWQMLQDSDCQLRVLEAIETKWWPTDIVENEMPNYWLLAPGEGGVLWDRWQADDVGTIGWREVGDLSAFDGRESLAERVAVAYPDSGSKAVTRMLWQFFKKMKPGDVVFAKRGRSGVYGWGVITGNYEYRDQDIPHHFARSIEWRSVEEVNMPTTILLPMQTLTQMDTNHQFLCEMRRAYEEVPGLENLDCEEEIVPIESDIIDLPAETDLAESTEKLIEAIEAEGYIFQPWQIATYITALRTKPFVILAGVSGTGKSKLPALVAKLTTGIIDRISVRPDWTDSSDVLGYVDLQDQFRPGVVLQAARNASMDPQRYHVCLLDEMNLARVEHYFAEALSAMEDRKKAAAGGYETTRLVSQTLPATYLSWQEQTMPANFSIVGTVNMDETSHGFSRKVLDRAFTLELSEVDLDLDGPTPTPNSSEPVYWPPTFWFCGATRIAECNQALPAFRENAEKATTLLQKANQCLVHNQLQVGYRTRDEVVLFLLNAKDIPYAFRTHSGEQIDPLDLAMMMKVLPRLVGGSISIRRTMLGLIGLGMNDQPFGVNDDSSVDTVVAAWNQSDRPDALENAKYPRTAARLCLMWERLIDEGYTSFWL
ncbi:AAA family ATPase [Novipirellula sp. SH528]|uniref:AAA family ATPase n=1 Tax=Novipirellula sp. SH528 TaxID=3454466 RepID=UPI003F9FAF78